MIVGFPFSHCDILLVRPFRIGIGSFDWKGVLVRTHASWSKCYAKDSMKSENHIENKPR